MSRLRTLEYSNIRWQYDVSGDHVVFYANLLYLTVFRDSRFVIEHHVLAGRVYGDDWFARLLVGNQRKADIKGVGF